MDNSEAIAWTASDSVINIKPKGRRNIIIIGVVFIALDVTLFLVGWVSIFTLISSAALVVAMVAAVFFMNKLPVKQLNYQLDNKGLTIEDKSFPFSDFRAFGVRQNGKIWQLVLIPNKRFSGELTAYIDADKGEEIVDLIATHLPMEEVPANAAEQLVNRLNF